VIQRTDRATIIVLGNHDGIVCSIVSSFSGLIIATGERASAPTGSVALRLWDSLTGDIVKRLPEHTCGISSIRFSDDDKMIVSLGEDIEHTLCVWMTYTGNWLDGSLRATFSTQRAPLHFAAFVEYALDAPSAAERPLIVTGGGKSCLGASIKFWRLDGRNAIGDSCAVTQLRHTYTATAAAALGNGEVSATLIVCSRPERAYRQ
jgi:WD40 repeat protein